MAAACEAPGGGITTQTMCLQGKDSCVPESLRATLLHPSMSYVLCAQVQGVNGLVARWNYLGFTATADSRQLRDVAGEHMQVGYGQRRVL